MESTPVITILKGMDLLLTVNLGILMAQEIPVVLTMKTICFQKYPATLSLNENQISKIGTERSYT